ncbi:hypothetical protein NRB_01920 [Novosphingobium sp. 11B]
MARQVRTTIRYDGPALAGHEMDVQDLAPALLALADVIQIANRKFNGNEASIKVLVNADVEQRCFMIDVSLVQSFLDQAKSFLGTDHVKTAYDIAQWVGIISGGTVSLFGLLKFLRGAKEASTPLSIQADGAGNVVVTGNGNTIVVRREVYQLAQDPKTVEKAKAVMKPLSKEGYETLAFLNDDVEVFEVDSDEARGIEGLPSQPLSAIPTESSSTIRGDVRIKSAQYEGGAQWGFLWNGRAISAEMADAAADWVAEFQANKVAAPPNSILDVSMIETAQLDGQGLAVGKPSYRVTEVHKVTPPPSQIPMFD